MHDVIIIGSGPAGSHLAKRLAALDYDVLVLERNIAAGENVICSGVIGTEAYETLDLPSVGILGSVQNVEFVGPLGANYIYRSKRELAKTVCRKTFDSALASKAMDAGANILFETLVRDIQPSHDFVNVTAEQKGELINLQARFCAVATGFGSELPSKLGCGKVPSTLQAAHLEVSIDSPGSHTEIYLGRDVAPKSFAWLTPLDNGRARVGLTTHTMAYQFLLKLLEHPHIRTRLVPKDYQPKLCLVPCGLIERPYAHRTMLVGEVAGQIKSTTSGGIYYAMLCANIAAEAIHLNLQGMTSPAQANLQYEKSMKKLLKKEIAFGMLLRRIFNRMGDKSINRMVSTFNSKILPISHMLDKVSFDWHTPVISEALKLPVFKSFTKHEEKAS